jgi:hypothetical protein
VALVLVALFGLMVKWAVDNTLTRHEAVDPGSSLVLTLRAERQSAAEHGEDAQVEAILAMCQLEVGATTAPDTFALVDDDRNLYSIEFHPSLDKADQRQLRGCIEDLRIDHFRAWVQSMEHVAP